MGEAYNAWQLVIEWKWNESRGPNRLSNSARRGFNIPSWVEVICKAIAVEFSYVEVYSAVLSLVRKVR
jgi:hypothetical protein